MNPDGWLTQSHSLNCPALCQDGTKMKNSHSQDSKKQEKVATVMGPGMLGGPWGHPFSSLGLSFPISRIRIDAFQLWCWRRLLRVSWTGRRPNQSILKEINPEYSLEGLMLKLKLQYFGYLMRRANALEKILMLGKIEGRRRRG